MLRSVHEKHERHERHEKISAVGFSPNVRSGTVVIPTARRELSITMSTIAWERCGLNIFVPFVLFADYAFLSSVCITSEYKKLCVFRMLYGE